MSKLEQEIKNSIEKYFKDLNEKKIERFFDDFKKDKSFPFISFYNRTVLNKEIISFGEFRYQWAIQGIAREVCDYFEKNQKKLFNEIKRKKDIEKFYNKYCKKGTVTERNEISFCSKLFHTYLPNEYPPMDSRVREKFRLRLDIASVLILKKAYKSYIKDNKDKINLIRKVLSKKKFSEFKVSKLSNIRILDMFLWFDNVEKVGKKSDIKKDYKSKLIRLYQMKNGQIAIRVTDSNHNIVSHRITGKILPPSTSDEKLGKEIRKLFKKCSIN